MSAPQHLFGFFEGAAFFNFACSSLVQFCRKSGGEVHFISNRFLNPPGAEPQSANALRLSHVALKTAMTIIAYIATSFPR